MSGEKLMAEFAANQERVAKEIADVRSRYPQLTEDEAEMYHILSVSSQYSAVSDKRFNRFVTLHKLGIADSDEDEQEERGRAEKAYQSRRPRADYKPPIRWKWDGKKWYDPKAVSL